MSYTANVGTGLTAADVAAVTGNNHNCCNNGGYGNGGFGWGGDGAWWLIVLFLFAANGNGWGFGNRGGNEVPYMLGNTNADVQRGFDQAELTAGINGLNSGIAGLNQSICSAASGLNNTVVNGFNTAEVSNNARQMANMNQLYTLQTGISNQLNSLAAAQAQCCCDNRLATANLQSTIISENCADRTLMSSGIRDIVENNSANTQTIVNAITQGNATIMNKICQLELNAKDDKIADLQSQLTMANLAASQSAQTAAILSNTTAVGQQIQQNLNPTPIPAYIVQNPSCCNQGYYVTNNGCGCNG